MPTLTIDSSVQREQDPTLRTGALRRGSPLQWCCVILLLWAACSPAQQNRDASSSPLPGAAPLSAVYLGKPEGLIHIDVTVTNRDGLPVTKLKQDDFTLLDKGRPNPIVSFEGLDFLHKPNPPVSVILLLDTLGMPADAAAKVRQNVVDFLRRNGGHLAQPVAIYSMNDEGFGLAASPSLDGNALAGAVERNQYLTKVMGSPSNMFSERDGFPVNADYSRNPVFTGLRALGVIATAERPLPGKKLVIWVGSGAGVGSGTPLLPSDRWRNLFESVTFTAGHALTASRIVVGKEDIFQKITWYSLLLREARITLDTLTTSANTSNALEQSIGLDWTRFVPGATSQQTAEPMDLYKNVLAVQTGGRANKANGDLPSQIAACLQYSGYFYTLSFNPPPTVNAHEYHALQVRLHDPGLRAHTFMGYYDEPYYADSPAPGIQDVTVAQLARIVDRLHNDPYAGAAQQLQSLRLTERLGSSQLKHLASKLHDKSARAALQVLAVISEFQDPPRAEIPVDPPPSAGDQRQILEQVTSYLDHAIPRLPDFSADRTAVEYAETPSYIGGISFVQLAPLQALRRTKAMVRYREGEEIVEVRGRERNKQPGMIVSYGTFGPILRTVRDALTVSGAVTWLHWEQGPTGKLAVFGYRVPAARSHYLVLGCCLPQGNGADTYETMPGYHGDVAVDSATGTIYRIDLIVDFHDYVPEDAVKMMVSYGPVTLSGTTYVVPKQSISMGRARTVEISAEWGPSVNPVGSPGSRGMRDPSTVRAEGFRTWGPWMTMLSEYIFDHYRVTRGRVQILPGFSEVPAGGSPQR